MNENGARDIQETEWQFDARDLRPIEAWLAARPARAIPRAGIARVEEITDVYLDTADSRIHAAGYALRVRSRPDRPTEATLKALASSGSGARVRREITEPLLGTKEGSTPEAPDLTRLVVAPGPVGQRLRALVGTRPLEPLFTWRTRRQVVPLLLDDQPLGDLSLDEGVVSPAGEAERPALLRVEVETTAEEQSPELERFVAALRDACALRVAHRSKYETGLKLSGRAPAARADLGPNAVTEGQSIGEAAFAVLRAQFDAFLRREPGTRLGEDVEELHDMRVATRRMRAALSLFADTLPLNAPEYRTELGWVASALGEVRDLDVQLEQVQGWKGEVAPADAPALDAMIAVLDERRAAARDRMLKALDSRRYELFVAGFTQFLQRGPTRRAGARAPVLAAAPDLIARRHRKVRRMASAISASSPEAEYHELRIAAKRLRYAVEFFAPLYGRSSRELIRRLVALQNLLGLHQDANVAVDHLRELAFASRRKLPPATVFIMGQIAGRYRREAGELREKFPKTYRKFRGRPWRSLKTMMESKRPHERRVAVDEASEDEAEGPLLAADLPPPEDAAIAVDSRDAAAR